jgi:hypothetical protein
MACEEYTLHAGVHNYIAIQIITKPFPDTSTCSKLADNDVIVLTGFLDSLGMQGTHLSFMINNFLTVPINSFQLMRSAANTCRTI